MQELLPNLLELEFSSNRGEKEFIAPLLLFTGSKLRKLTIGAWPEEVAPSLAYIPQRFPDLIHLTIRQPRCQSSAIVSCIQPLIKLKTLSCYPASLKLAFDAAGRMPFIESLELRVYTSSIDSIIFYPDTFSFLTSLHLFVLLDSCVDLLEYSPAPKHLRTLHIEGSAANLGVGTARRILNALPQAVPQITTLTFYDHTLDDAQLTFQDLQAVCSLSLLSRLYIRHARGINLNEENLVQVLTACPKLQGLVLSYVLLPVTSQNTSRRLRWNRPSLSLTVLDAVAAACPEMRYLGLCLDAVVPDGHLRDTIREPGHVLPNLTNLDITLSPIGDPVLVAEYLATRSLGCFNIHWKTFRANKEEIAEPLKGAEDAWSLACRIVDALRRQAARTERRLIDQMEESTSPT